MYTENTKLLTDTILYIQKITKYQIDEVQMICVHRPDP